MDTRIVRTMLSVLRVNTYSANLFPKCGQTGAVILNITWRRRDRKIRKPYIRKWFFLGKRENRKILFYQGQRIFFTSNSEIGRIRKSIQKFYKYDSYIFSESILQIFYGWKQYKFITRKVNTLFHERRITNNEMMD